MNVSSIQINVVMNLIRKKISMDKKVSFGTVCVSRNSFFPFLLDCSTLVKSCLLNKRLFGK